MDSVHLGLLARSFIQYHLLCGLYYQLCWWHYGLDSSSWHFFFRYGFIISNELFPIAHVWYILRVRTSVHSAHLSRPLPSMWGSVTWCQTTYSISVLEIVGYLGKVDLPSRQHRRALSLRCCFLGKIRHGVSQLVTIYHDLVVTWFQGMWTRVPMSVSISVMDLHLGRSEVLSIRLSYLLCWRVVVGFRERWQHEFLSYITT